MILAMSKRVAERFMERWKNWVPRGNERVIYTLNAHTVAPVFFFFYGMTQLGDTKLVTLIVRRG